MKGLPYCTIYLKQISLWNAQQLFQIELAWYHHEQAAAASAPSQSCLYYIILIPDGSLCWSQAEQIISTFLYILLVESNYSEKISLKHTPLEFQPSSRPTSSSPIIKEFGTSNCKLSKQNKIQRQSRGTRNFYGLAVSPNRNTQGLPKEITSWEGWQRKHPDPQNKKPLPESRTRGLMEEPETDIHCQSSIDVGNVQLAIPPSPHQHDWHPACRQYSILTAQIFYNPPISLCRSICSSLVFQFAVVSISFVDSWNVISVPITERQMLESLLVGAIGNFIAYQ